MPDIHDVMDVTMEELAPKQQVQLKDAIDQCQQKCLMSYAKDRSGVPYLKSDMPRVLLLGEPDTTSAEEKQEVMNAVQQTMESIMVKHNTAFLNMF
jgi:RNA processing factor Prp31